MSTIFYTYINGNNKPMIRRCENCKHWQRLKKLTNDADIAPSLQRNTENLTEFSNDGYCKIEKVFHAFSLKQNHYKITKKHNLCQKHEFTNEDFLSKNAQKVPITEILNKND